MTKDITEKQYEKVVKQNSDLQKENRNLRKELNQVKKQYEPFEDEYFKGLSYAEIAGLAKTRMGIGQELNDIIHILEYIKDELADLDVSNTHINNVLKSINGVISNDEG